MSDLISRQAVRHILNHEVKMPIKVWKKLFELVDDLPPVSPTRPKGKWIMQDVHNCHTDFKCSECGYIHNFMHLYGEPTADYTFCPNCGADMTGSEE